MHTVGNDIEVAVETRHLENLGQCQTHLGGQRGQVGLAQITEMILDPVQMFDQQIALPRSLAK